MAPVKPPRLLPTRIRNAESMDALPLVHLSAPGDTRACHRPTSPVPSSPTPRHGPLLLRHHHLHFPRRPHPPPLCCPSPHLSPHGAAPLVVTPVLDRSASHFCQPCLDLPDTLKGVRCRLQSFSSSSDSSPPSEFRQPPAALRSPRCLDGLAPAASSSSAAPTWGRCARARDACFLSCCVE